MLLFVSLGLFLEKLILISVLLGISLLVAMYTTYGERKIAAFMQDRTGPNRAGPFGILQPLADGLKLFMKEEIIPAHAQGFLFVLGPSLAMIAACMSGAVIPWGDTLTIFGREVSLQVADVSIGVLYVFGVVSLGVYAIMIGGWASNNKFSLMGAIRAASQAISYELAMGLALIALVMLCGSLSLKDIVNQQHGFWHDGWFSWNFFKQPLAFLIFLICVFAECNRTPFDLPECESELIGGFHTEFSSMKLGFYLFSEYINMFISSAVMACLFFGGYNFPGMDYLTSIGWSGNIITLIGIGVLFAKILFFIFLFIWVRWSIPRFRYDQLMNLGWKVLIPLALFNVLITGAVLLLNSN